MHTLIVGDIGVGKSTLINKLIKELNREVFGFQTKKIKTATFEGIYIGEFGKEIIPSNQNLLGIVNGDKVDVIKDSFNNFSKNLLKPIPKNYIIVFDELGFMERDEEEFCSTILSLFDGDTPIIAAVKSKKDISFLKKIKNHKKTKIFYINEKNRNLLFLEMPDFVKHQLL